MSCHKPTISTKYYYKSNKWTPTNHKAQCPARFHKLLMSSERVTETENDKVQHASTAVIAVALTGKASFVHSYMQTRPRGQYNGKWPFSLVYVLKPRTTGIKATAPSPLKQWNKVHCNFYYHQTDIPTYSFVQFQGLLPQVPKIVRDKCEPNTTYTLLYCTLYFAGFQYNIHFHPKSNRAAHGVEVNVSPLPYFIIILL